MAMLIIRGCSIGSIKRVKLPWWWWWWNGGILRSWNIICSWEFNLLTRTNYSFSLNFYVCVSFVCRFVVYCKEMELALLNRVHIMINVNEGSQRIELMIQPTSHFYRNDVKCSKMEEGYANDHCSTSVINCILYHSRLFIRFISFGATFQFNMHCPNYPIFTTTCLILKLWFSLYTSSRIKLVWIETKNSHRENWERIVIFVVGFVVFIVRFCEGDQNSKLIFEECAWVSFDISSYSIANNFYSLYKSKAAKRSLISSYKLLRGKLM